MCDCDCGGTIVVPTYQLNAGNRTNCGCRTQDIVNDYIGKQFGDLTVISFHSRDEKNRMIFECKCICGNTKLVKVRNLQRKVSTHCGCKTTQKSYKRKAYGESSKNRLIASYRSNAKHKKLDFELSNQDLEQLFQGDCYYCGTKPSQIIKNANLYGEYVYNGIDRLDSSKGYVKGNVVSCCSTCNYLKSNRTEEEFLDIIKKIASHRLDMG